MKNDADWLTKLGDAPNTSKLRFHELVKEGYQVAFHTDEALFMERCYPATSKLPEHIQGERIELK